MEKMKKKKMQKQSVFGVNRKYFHGNAIKPKSANKRIECKQEN